MVTKYVNEIVMINSITLSITFPHSFHFIANSIISYQTDPNTYFFILFEFNAYFVSFNFNISLPGPSLTRGELKTVRNRQNRGTGTEPGPQNR